MSLGQCDDDALRSILQETRTIAVVGASANPARPSHSVMHFLQGAGYRVVPVNPGLAGQQLLGETCYASLGEVPFPIDLVDIFRNSAEAGAAADEAVKIGAKTVWMQIGVRNEAGAARAEAAGLRVVMDRCTKIDWARLIGNHA